jgi:hydroxymethylpyrimidine/phosphomethylpyrimidine kinase
MTPTALTIAGSDSGGGAGIQADLKTFAALGVHGACAVTAITAQNTRSVTAVLPMPPELVASQIDAVFADLDVRAVKIGMLATPDIVEAVAHALGDRPVPVVLDPVMVAKSGAALLEPDAEAALTAELLPLATLLTPNLPEAARLLGTGPAVGCGEMERQARALLDLGPAAVLMKGGHASGTNCTDLLVRRGVAPVALTLPRIDTRNTHGTGCTLSAGIAAGLARGADLDAAVRAAHGYLHAAIAAADRLRIGHGHGPVHHFHAFWSDA